MARLADLANLAETVRVRGVDFTVRPLDLATIATLLATYPAFAKALGEGDIVAAITASGSDVVNAVIDAALGEAPGSAARARLTAIEQGTIVAAAVELTLPVEEAELGNFMTRLGALLGRVGRVASAVTPAAGSN
jgi:hypothetical protein